ncbi:putative cellulose synthase (UDP-forming) [Helianthus annuus]|nr:putative cellulose synthase (UDP-forming) [Helianthus annuus]
MCPVLKVSPLPSAVTLLVGIGVAEKEPVTRNTMAGYLSNNIMDVGLHARTVSTVLTVDSDMIDEGGNPIWKNRVESWKDKKKKRGGKVAKEVQVPVDQHIEEKQQSSNDRCFCRSADPECNAATFTNNSNSEKPNRTLSDCDYSSVNHFGTFLPVMNHESC